MTKTTSRVLVQVALLAVYCSCAFADMTWTLNNVYFDLNPPPNTLTNHAVGYFTVNSAVTGITDWSIDISGTNPQGVFDYLPSNSSVFLFAPTKIIFVDPSFNYITIFLPGGGGLTNTPGSLPLEVNIGSDFTDTSLNCQGCGTLRAGASIVGSATSHNLDGTVPEPSALVLLGTIVGLLGLKVCRKRAGTV